MARIKDPDQKRLLKDASRKFGMSENDVAWFLLNRGLSFCIMAYQSPEERAHLFEKIDEQIKEDDKFSELMKFFFDRWTDGLEEPPTDVEKGVDNEAPTPEPEA